MRDLHADRAEAGFDGRAYALAIASVRLLTAIGVSAPGGGQGAADAADQGQRWAGWRRRGPLFLHFDAAEIEEGPMGHMLEDRHLYAAFLDAMTATRGSRLSGETVQAQEVGPSGVSR